MQNPRFCHFKEALRALRYLRSDLGQRILLNFDPSLRLLAFCDADRAFFMESHRSVSGFYITLDASPIYWKSKMQAFTSLSSSEVKYRSMHRVVAELTWLTRLLDDLSILPSLPVPIFSDSKAAIHIARNPIFHERTKHAELDCHFIRQQFLSSLVTLSFVPSSSQLADLFTKSLSGPSHILFLASWGSLLYSPT